MASSWHSFQQGFLAFEQSFVGASIEVLLVIYLFLGIAYAADDYFVESLNIIASKVGMSDDVAGSSVTPHARTSRPWRDADVGVSLWGFGGDWD